MGTELKKFMQNGSPEANETKTIIEAGGLAPMSAVVKMTQNFLEVHQ